ncbi:DNA replication/repair protein RecF [Chryseobacterium sp. A301]
MVVSQLHIAQFKNHLNRDFEFSSQINCFVGNNGCGKTNLLDALHYLSVGKSFLLNTDSLSITQGKDFFSLKAEIQEESTLEEGTQKYSTLQLQMPLEGKKNLKKNEKIYPRLADHIGYLPTVLISPYDSNLITDSGESRRRFLDHMISQTDPEYLFELIQYQKTLKQRNALLKYFQKNRSFDLDSLEIYTAPLLEFGVPIFEKRKKFIESLNPLIQQFYSTLSAGKESISVRFQSELNGVDFQTLLESNLSKDRQLTYTSSGIHKDDLLFEMNGTLLKKTGSQGQQKSFLIALKLAQIKRLVELTHKTPILLLDDIFDKLDSHRVSNLIALINREKFGQMFITDTDKQRTEEIVKRIHEDSKIFEISSQENS